MYFWTGGNFSYFLELFEGNPTPFNVCTAGTDNDHRCFEGLFISYFWVGTLPAQEET